MLIDFSIENYLSIKNRLNFSLVESDDEEGSKIKIHRANGYLNLLPAITIYGFNASGKSNFLKALDMAKNQIVFSKISNPEKLGIDIFQYKPFKLSDAYRDKPTSYQLRAVVDNYIYDYQVRYDKNSIIYERLSSFDSEENYNLLFDRTYNDFTLDISIDEDILRKIMGPHISKRPLIGSVSIFDERVESFINWVENDLIIIKNNFDSRENIQKTTRYLLEKGDIFHVKLLRMLSDISYSNISSIQTQSLSQALQDSDIDETIKNELRESSLYNSIRQNSTGRDDGDSEAMTLNTFKRGLDIEGNSKDVIFNLFEESEGTIKIYALYAYIYDALYNGKTLVIDEMTSYIHPLVSQYIIGLFQNPVENKSGQLITTTHTTDLLEMKSLRRDQVYITDMDFNETTIYSLADIMDVSKSENFRNAYLAGKYGGLNYFRRELHE
ncbi:AAA family ATPase [Peptostreptococcus stomatis]|uniref:AAA family ATPase n=1 Tax=Peptostreptococcus stomatis TaxID=341694 RepID=UPI0026EEEFE9|nr:ATP-binding protein [Peptostreptococcus stomatis]